MISWYQNQYHADINADINTMLAVQTSGCVRIINALYIKLAIETQCISALKL